SSAPRAKLVTGGGAGNSGCRGFAVDPRSFEFLILRWVQQAARVATFPPNDLIRFAALVAGFFPACFPRGGPGVGGWGLLVPKQDLTVAVALHSHRHGRECRGAKFRRTPSFAPVGADAFEEVFP